MPTIAIYGAGPSLGMAVARRFGREDHRVALVARSRARLDGMVGELAAEGIEAAGFEADLADQAATMHATDQIEARFGTVDVLEHSPTPGGGGGRFAGPLDLEVPAVSRLLEMYLLTPIALTQRLLPGMRERGHGGLLFSMGAAAKYPIPQFVSVGIALSGLRNYVHTLNAALNGSGVYAGALLIGATIENSRTHQSQSMTARVTAGLPQKLVRAEDLADRLWEMYANGSQAEEVIAPALAHLRD